MKDRAIYRLSPIGIFCVIFENSVCIFAFFWVAVKCKCPSLCRSGTCAETKVASSSSRSLSQIAGTRPGMRQGLLFERETHSSPPLFQQIALGCKHPLFSFNKWPQPVLPSYKYQIYPGRFQCLSLLGKGHSSS